MGNFKAVEDSPEFEGDEVSNDPSKERNEAGQETADQAKDDRQEVNNNASVKRGKKSERRSEVIEDGEKENIRNGFEEGCKNRGGGTNNLENKEEDGTHKLEHKSIYKQPLRCKIRTYAKDGA